MIEPSLTRDEAEERARLIAVDRYDIAVDLRGLWEGEVLESTSTITFRCLQPGADTFVDCLAEVRSATLNGADLELSTVVDGRIHLADLAADNVLVVSAAQSDTASGAGILRTVDASDKLVYVWTSFEPDDARRAWACFDQPDLKAPHRFTVCAPESWTVTSNDGPESVTALADGGRLWTFPDTPPLSTYVVVVNAGPFHEIREERGDHSLGLFCRQSLRAYLERDAEELFTVTEQGLAFFAERFEAPFPQRRYDQVFVPNMGGAMENWGCVTWTDSVLFRSPPTYGQRGMVASVLLHEMAHMWFGDLVTMRWWDDLWLNEAFASFAATWAEVGGTAYVDGWATFLAGLELTGYQADMGPASHPIRGAVPDVATAMANFDAITYVKGQAVLRQLVAFVGEDVFVAGLRAYFRDHAWGNTRLDDLMAAVGVAAGLDLSSWTVEWFDRAGTDTITLTDDAVLVASPDSGPPRPHRLDVGSYRRSGDALERVALTELRTDGVRLDRPDLPDADLHLLNDGDLTFAAVRTDERSQVTLLDGAGGLPDPLSRALAVSTTWDMVLKGELPTARFLDCVLGVLAVERSAGVVEPFLGLALRAADQWTAPGDSAPALARLAEVAHALADQPDHRAPALRTLAASATDNRHFAVLADAASDDTDLAWRVLVRRAMLGDHDPTAVETLLARDRDPEAWVRALGVTAARADDAAKQDAWTEIFEKRSVPASVPLIGLADAFWRPGQGDLMVGWAHRYLDVVESLSSGGGLLAVGGLVRGMFPTTGDDAFCERARAIAEADATAPFVRSALLTGSDTITRVLRARRAG